METERRTRPAHLPVKLSPREDAVLRQLAEGAPRKAVADSLGISPRTVRAYIESARKKFAVASTIRAVVANAIRSTAQSGSYRKMAAGPIMASAKLKN